MEGRREDVETSPSPFSPAVSPPRYWHCFSIYRVCLHELLITPVNKISDQAEELLQMSNGIGSILILIE